MSPTPDPNSKSVPWWQSLLSTVVGAAITAILGHYLGPTGAIVAAGVSTGIAHNLPSPASQVKN